MTDSDTIHVPFAFLQKVDSDSLLTFIMDEHPQTIALVVSFLKPTQAAAVLDGLPPERQLAVVRRIAVIGQVSPRVIKEVERGLEHRLANVLENAPLRAGGIEAVADILGVIDSSTQRNILENLSQDSPDMVAEVRRLLPVQKKSFLQRTLVCLVKFFRLRKWKTC